MLDHCWDEIELETSPLWYRASMSMGLKIVPDFLVEDFLRINDRNSNCFYKVTTDFEELTKIFTRHLEEIGITNNNILEESGIFTRFLSNDYMDLWESKEVKSFPEAIKISYERAYEEFRKLISRQVRLLTRMDDSHTIYSLLPRLPKKD